MQYSSGQCIIGFLALLLMIFGKVHFTAPIGERMDSPGVSFQDVSRGIWMLDWDEAESLPPGINAFRYTDMPPNYESCVEEDLESHTETPPPNYGSVVWGIKPAGNRKRMSRNTEESSV